MYRIICIYMLFCCASLSSATIYVDNVKGDNRNDGSKEKPVSCIQQALRMMKKSDCMEVINTGKPYQRPYPGDKGRNLSIPYGGTLEAPMVINGNGAVITGLTVIPTDKWTKLEDNIYSLPFWPMSNMYKSYKKQNYWLDGTQIWWVDGKAAPNCKNMDELKATSGGFWWDKSKRIVLFNLPKDKKLEQLKVELPGNSGFYITADHTIVKNFYVIHSWNDGFDANKKNQNGIFKNCVAIDNCGQGFSCHDTSNIYYEDCVAIRCASSGSCDVNWCTTRYKRGIFMDNTFEAGIYTTENSSHLYSDCLIVNNKPFEQIWQRGNSSQIYDNCVIIGTDDQFCIMTMQNGSVAFKNCTIMNANGIVELTNSKYSPNLSIDNCLIIGMKRHIINLGQDTQAKVFMTGNLYVNSAGVLVGDKHYNASNWDEFKKIYKNDSSTWLSSDQKIEGTTTDIKLPTRYKNPNRVGAVLPQEVRERYEMMKKAKASPSGVSFE